MGTFDSLVQALASPELAAMTVAEREAFARGWALATTAMRQRVNRAKCGEALCLIYSDGKLLLDSNFRDEAHAWTVGLGWPTQEEIECQKQEGARVVRGMVLAIPFRIQRARSGSPSQPNKGT